MSLRSSKSFETDLCEECEVKQDVKHILLYCNKGILQESRRIFTNNYQGLRICAKIKVTHTPEMQWKMHI